MLIDGVPCLATKPLGPLNEDILRLQQLLMDLGQTLSLSLLQCKGQYVQNLMGKSKGKPTELSGSLFDPEKWVKKWSETGNEKAVLHYQMCQMHLAYYFDDLELAGRIAAKLKIGFKDETGPGPWAPGRLMFHGLVFFALFKSTGKRRFLRKANQTIKICSGLAKIGCINVAPALSLLQAEQMASLHPDKSDDVQSAFEKAIVMSGRTGVLNIRALSNELAFKFFQDHDKLKATAYLRESIDVYAQWGCNAKVTQLMRKHGALLGSKEKSMASILSSATSKSCSSGILARPRFDSLSTHGCSQFEVGFLTR